MDRADGFAARSSRVLQGAIGYSHCQSRRQILRLRCHADDPASHCHTDGAATIPQGGARPAAGNQREMATDGEASRPRDAEIPLANVRSAPKPALARPPPTRRTVRKGRLNYLCSRRCLMPHHGSRVCQPNPHLSGIASGGYGAH